ncbi:unnamed protein product [Lymnaea stagnalis]|uniref:Uncharacterized protein n=1 Tax=Lymnaea stagnalis TaxID=6523 RepID=A0AAV2HA15_LYMST
MADHNESPSATENSFSQEFINTTDAEEEEFLYPEPPAYSLDDPNARENSRRNWATDGDEVEQEGSDYNAATEAEYEENGTASSRLYRDHPKTRNGSQHYASRRPERVQTRQLAGSYFVKDYLTATAAKSGRPHSAQSRSDRAQVHRYLEASTPPCQDQVVSLTRAEQTYPPEPAVNIVYVAMEQPRRPENVRSYIACSVCVCFCCNLPLGLIAIYLSYQAKTLWLKGDYRRAKSYSRAALIVNITSVILGIVLTVVLPVIFVVIQTSYKIKKFNVGKN